MSFDPAILARTVAADMDDIALTEYGRLALYSPSDVKTLVEKFSTENLPAVAVFGEGTLRAALDAGITVLANAPTPEAPSMVKAIEMCIRDRHLQEFARRFDAVVFVCGRKSSKKCIRDRPTSSKTPRANSPTPSSTGRPQTPPTSAPRTNAARWGIHGTACSPNNRPNETSLPVKPKLRGGGF